MTVRFKTILEEPEVTLRYGPEQQKVSQRFRQLDLREKGLGPIRVSKRFAKLDFRNRPAKKLRARFSRRFWLIAKAMWPEKFPARPASANVYHGVIQVTAMNASSNTYTIRFTRDQVWNGSYTASIAVGNLYRYTLEDLNTLAENA